MAGNKNSGRKNYPQELARKEALKRAWQIVENNLNKKKDIKVALPIVLKDLGNKLIGDANNPLIIQVATELQDRYTLESKVASTVERTEVKQLDTPAPHSETDEKNINTGLDIFPQIETNNLANTSSINDVSNPSTIPDNEGQPPLPSD